MDLGRGGTQCSDHSRFGVTRVPILNQHFSSILQMRQLRPQSPRKRHSGNGTPKPVESRADAALFGQPPDWTAGTTRLMGAASGWGTASLPTPQPLFAPTDSQES